MEVIDVTLRESIHTQENINYKNALRYISKICNNFNRVSFVEIGYLDRDVNGKDLGKYNKEYFNKAYEITKNNVKLSAMLHIKEFYPENWDNEVLNNIDMVRILIDEDCNNLNEIVTFFHKYNIEVSVNCSYISRKTERQFNEIIDKIVGTNVDTIYIADTNGSMLEKDLGKWVDIIKNKGEKVKIGIHTHNHMQLALSNAFNLREKVDFIDGSINGFGKGAGNAKLETLIMLLSKVNNNIISDNELYQMYKIIQFFYEDILSDFSNRYIIDFSNLMYAYKNLKLKQINEYQKINIENRVPKLLNIENYKIKDAVEFAKNKVSFYKNYNNSFEDMPILNKEIYRKNVPPYSNKLLSDKIKSSFIFSTSGTTGNPQFVVRDVDDINYQINDYVGLNINENDVVLNLFWSGIWGIYTTANLTLEKTGATVIPVGGNNLNDEMLKNIEYMITSFNVNVLFGVPSTIVSITNYIKNNKECIKSINKIFCLGEKMYEDTFNYLKEIYGDVEIKTKYGCMESAGIGYQCKNLNCNEYHIFKNRYIEILDIDTDERLENGKKGKIVVTTLNKRLVPLLRYDTGDIGCIEKRECECGEHYVLRIDNRIGKEFIIGSVHLITNKIIEIIQSNSYKYNISQIIIDKKNQMDQLNICIQADEINENKILLYLYKEYPDVKILIDEKKINKINITKVNNDELILNKKTGKIYPLIDTRK